MTTLSLNLFSHLFTAGRRLLTFLLIGSLLSAQNVSKMGPVIIGPGDGIHVNLDIYAKHDAKYFGSCSFTNASATVNCASASFVSGDVNKLVVLFAARANGSGATATSTLSSGVLNTPTVTAAGSGYFTAPSVAVTGLTCTYVPELKAVLNGSSYVGGNAVASITVIYGGFGCTGTPTITITAGPALALGAKVASVIDGTHITISNTSSVLPTVTGSGAMLYGTDDGATINTLLQTYAQNSDTGLNPVTVRCNHLFLSSQTINFVNKSFYLDSPGPANLSSTGSGTPSLLGCGVYYVNQSYSAPSDAVYIAGAQMSYVRGMHVYSVSGNKQRAGFRFQQAASQTHNTQFNRIADNIIGPWYTGGPNGNDPEATACFTGSFVLNQCAQFNWGIMMDSPAGFPTTGGANNDQMEFSNNMVVGVDIGFYAFSNQSAELLLDRFMCDGCNFGVGVQSNLSCRECDMSNSLTADFQLADPNYNNVNGLIRVDLQNFTSEGSHQFIQAAAENGGTINTFALYFHGQVSWQVGSATIKSGMLVDMSPQQGGGNVTIMNDNGITLLGVLPATTAPINYRWYAGPGYADGPEYIQNGVNKASNVNDPPLSQFGNLQLTYTDYRHTQWIKRDWTPAPGQRCHTDMIYYGGSPDSIECNNTTVIGKHRIVGKILVSQLGTPLPPSCTKLSGSGANSYFYKIAGVVAGVIGQASAEVSCTGQNASLSASAVNQVCGVPMAGAQQYAIYESTTTGTEKLLATVNADQMVVGPSNTNCYNDAAGGAAGANPLAVDNTGGMDLPGPLVLGQGLPVPSLNISADGVMTKNPRIPWTGYVRTTGNATVTFAQWVNSTPVKMTTLFGITQASSAGCTSPTAFWIHDVGQNTDSTQVTIANGAGNTNSLINQTFHVAAGDTVQMRYTAVGCTTQLFDFNLTAEFEPE